MWSTSDIDASFHVIFVTYHLDDLLLSKWTIKSSNNLVFPWLLQLYIFHFTHYVELDFVSSILFHVDFTESKMLFLKIFKPIEECLTRIHDLKAAVTAKVVVCYVVAGVIICLETQKGSLFCTNMRKKLPWQPWNAPLYL